MIRWITMQIKASGHSNIYFELYNKHMGARRYNYLYRLYEKSRYPHFGP